MDHSSNRYECDNPKEFAIYLTNDTELVPQNGELENFCLWSGIWTHSDNVIDDDIYCKSELTLGIMIFF